jgi:mannan endo-1,4-beta-mannosidase
MLAATSSSASAAVTRYLRPNEDVSLGSWSVVGAASAWDALNDEVTELQTPSSLDYLTTSTASTKARWGLQSTSLAGNKLLSATAWIYTANANPMSFKASNSETWTTVTSAGWHSAPVTLTGKQTQLDNLNVEINSGSGTTSRVVRAAFVKLTIEPSAPKVYWGARMDGDVRLLKEPPEEAGGDAPWNSTTWDEFVADAGGKSVSIVHFGQPPPWQQEFAAEPFELTINRGAIPLVSMGTTGATLSELAYSPVASSVPLQKFTKWANEIHNFGHPFFLRLDWEMNLISSKEFQWVNEARTSPSTFVAAWRRLHDIADEQGASNITWTWCPNVSYLGSTSLKALFPGRTYVDWTCMDGYNRGFSPDWASFSEVFATTYSEILALTDSSVTPPMMIGETASVENGPTAKARWIAEALGTEIPSSFSKLKAFVWFNWNIYDESIGARWDWPIETSPASRESFANAISSPFYAEGSFGSLPLLEPVQPLP